MATVHLATNTLPAVLSWQRFQDMFVWNQGEHVTLIGPTGCGKTTLLKPLMEQRAYVMFLGSKRTDETQESLKHEGYLITSDPDEIHPDVNRRWVVRPTFSPRMTVQRLRETNADIFRRALMRAYTDGSWCVVMDEGRYLTDYLGLKDEAILLWTQGRSQGNSVVTGTQRPRFVPLEAYDQATHLFFWRDPDAQNIKRIAEVASVNRNEILRVVPNLPRHAFLYVNTITGETAISKVAE